MNKEKLDKLNGMVNSIDDMEKILAMDGQELSIYERHAITKRFVTIDRCPLSDALTAHIDKLKAELKELGYEDD